MAFPTISGEVLVMGTIRRAGLAGLALILTWALAVAPAGAAVAPAGGGAPRPDLQQALEEVVRSGASAALAEVRDEQGRWRGSAGEARLGTGRPVPVNGRFRVGSITKSFVATVVLQLSAERRLRLDDPIERHLPGLVPGGAGITVRQLLNHTSGIFNYTEDSEALPLVGAEFLAQTRFRTYRPEQLVRIATAHPPYFPPGQGWHYSNTNYILAGLIIEKVTGRPYGHEVERRIIRPLGLRHTYVPGRSPFVPGPHAHGYLGPYAGEDPELRTVDITNVNPTWAWAAGEIISTTADLNRFYTALFGGRLLRPAQLAEMRATVPVEPGYSYGLGVYSLDLPCGGRLWGHDGGIHGYLTWSLHSEDGRRHLTLSVNPMEVTVLDGVNQLILTEFCGAPSPTARTTERSWALPSYRGIL
jgi:D-alanyl-D-alanine carboxypeptidase